jgi:hypothetical protein
MIITPQNITRQYYGKLQGNRLVEDKNGSVRVWEFQLEKDGQTATYRAYVHKDNSDYANDNYQIGIGYQRLVVPENKWIDFDISLVGLQYSLSAVGTPRNDRYIDLATEDKKYPAGTYDFGEVKLGDTICAFDTNGDLKPNTISQVAMVSMLKKQALQELNDKALALMLFNL